MIILPRDDVKKQSVLSPIAEKFVPDRVYGEQEVNEIIKSFEVEDHVLFRRELINFGYLSRDPYKAEYRLIRKHLDDKELQKIKARQGKFQ